LIKGLIDYKFIYINIVYYMEEISLEV